MANQFPCHTMLLISNIIRLCNLIYKLINFCNIYFHIINSIVFNNGELFICHLEHTPKKREKRKWSIIQFMRQARSTNGAWIPAVVHKHSPMASTSNRITFPLFTEYSIKDDTTWVQPYMSTAELIALRKFATGNSSSM